MSVLPNLVIIGAMKCGTSALHGYLDRHPEIAMSKPKELNFFFGPGPHTGAGKRAVDDGTAPQDGWSLGNWHRGVAWYAQHFSAEVPVRGESSPGYTSPDHLGVAERMAAVIPRARLIYMVRDPIERAVSQYRHHRRDGTERRLLSEALLDMQSQYVARSLYYRRVEPFLRHFPRNRIAIVAQEELASTRGRALGRLFNFLGVDDAFETEDVGGRRRPPQGRAAGLSRDLIERLSDLLAGDADRLRELAGRDFSGWRL